MGFDSFDTKGGGMSYQLMLQKIQSIWCLIRSAMAGEEQDFTKGNLRVGMFVLAVPMVLEMIMESVFAIVDIFFVEKLGAEAVATVGLTESVQTVVFAVGIGLGMGTTAMVARRIGEGDRDGARVVAFQAIVIGVLASLPFLVIGQWVPEKVLQLMGAEQAVIDMGAGYTKVLLTGNIFIIQLFLINAIFRGAGNPILAMRSLWLANAINILLDPCLIFGLGPFPELGVAGAAWATNIGRGCGVLYQVRHLMRGSGHIHLHRDNMRVHWQVAMRLVRVSLWGIVQFLIATSSWIFLMRIVARFGSQALAGYTIAIRVVMFTFLPSWGFSNSAATLVGQNLGAEQPERAERAVWLTGNTNAAFMLLVSLAFLLFPATLMGIFTADPLVSAHGVSCLRVLAIGYPMYAYGMVLIQSFNGAGDTLRPTVINLVCYWMTEIPLAWTLAVTLNLGPLGVYWAIVLAESMMTVIGFFVFRRGQWKHKVL